MEARDINHSLDQRRDEQRREQQTDDQSQQATGLFTDAIAVWQPILESQVVFLKALANGLQMFNMLTTDLINQQQQQGRRDTGQNPQGSAYGRYGGQRS